MDPVNPDAGCVYRSTLVTRIDKARTTDAAFKIYVMYAERDSLECINVGSMLVHAGARNGP